MEALSGSVLPSTIREPSRSPQSPPPSTVKIQTGRHVCCFRIKENSNFGCLSSFRTRAERAADGSWAVRAVAREVSDGGGAGDEGTSGNGGLIPKKDFRLECGCIACIVKSDASLDGSEQRGEVENLMTPMPTIGACGQGGSSRAGLFRTPISGGVQSATSAHDLPRPALAVRNLMEQVWMETVLSVFNQCLYLFESTLFFLYGCTLLRVRLLLDTRMEWTVKCTGAGNISRAHWNCHYSLHFNWYLRRMKASLFSGDIYFIGGFGTVAWVDVKEYESVQPDKIAVDGGEQNLKELNAIFSKPLKELLSAETEIDDAALISIDSKGTDIRVRQGAQFNIQRLSFESGQAVQTLEEAKAALHKLISKAHEKTK
ncbi:hypothetical protein ACLOJK_030799 [Asimina triloba]